MTSKPILSATRLASIRKLTQKKFRLLNGQFLVEGKHLVEEAVNSTWSVVELLATEQFLADSASRKLVSRAEEKNIPVHRVSESEVEKLSDAVTPQGVVAVVAVDGGEMRDFWNATASNGMIVGLDGVTDPGNVGTMIRTCDWFGVSACCLGAGSVDLYNPKVLRSTMGGVFHLPVVQDVNLVETALEAKRRGFRIFGTAMDGGSRPTPEMFSGKSLLIFGSESHGVSRELERIVDQTITISRFGRSESLNVAVACGIILAMARIR